MTRFARAKGSKSSNFRTPEDSTDWAEMKKDMQEKILKNKTDEASEVHSESDEVVEINSSPVKSKKSEPKKEPQWAEFDSSDNGTHASAGSSKKRSSSFEEQSDENGLKKKKKKHSKKEVDHNSQDSIPMDAGNTENNGEANFKNSKKGKNKKKGQAKPVENETTVKVNGIYIAVKKFDGYFVKAEDADRLKALQKRMVKEGIPREEIYKVIKLERRKAEKAFAKEKKKVCFQCRKPGHKLSECPLSSNNVRDTTGDDETATGLCYKCGSTEHTHFECKVQKGKDYRFAKCFICQEQGHISNQCPDNPKGLYPRGGGCNICGEVTHLKKDCPQLVKTRSEAVVTLSTFASGTAVEDIDGSVVKSEKSIEKPSKKKIVKF